MSKNAKYLDISAAIARLSKDSSTKVGALILGPDGEGGPWGYNGSPRGCNADEDERGRTRPEKYYWIEHAERNAIYTAARRGFATLGCSIVVTHPPCMDCARAIVQAGITKVVFPTPSPDFYERWEQDLIRVADLFKECGVEVEVV